MHVGLLASLIGLTFTVSTIAWADYDPETQPTPLEIRPDKAPKGLEIYIEPGWTDYVPEKTTPGSRRLVGYGTAFHSVRKGYFVTNYHVIEGAKEIQLSRKDKSCSANVVAGDKANDLAILKVPDTCVVSLNLGSPFELGSSQVATGQDVITFGFPLPTEFAAKPQVSKGIVKSITGPEGDTRTLTISNSIQPGSSGGPLFGPDGTVVGVVTAAANVHYLYPRYGTIPQNLNFAIRAEYVRLLFQLNGIQGAQQKTTSSLRKQPRNGLPGFISAIKRNVVLVTAIPSQ